MGKVLIALCTVFLLAFPARGEQAVTWESLTVWNDLPPLYDPAPWPSDLAGKRVILRWNGKHNGDLLLDYLHSLLSRAFPDTEFIKAYETDPTLSGISKDLPESEATARALLELRPDLVIAATGDCRACSAWLAIDQIQLERAGVPTPSPSSATKRSAPRSTRRSPPSLTHSAPGRRRTARKPFRQRRRLRRKPKHRPPHRGNRFRQTFSDRNGKSPRGLRALAQMSR